jgi:hypothetical protein
MEKKLGQIWREKLEQRDKDEQIKNMSEFYNRIPGLIENSIRYSIQDPVSNQLVISIDEDSCTYTHEKIYFNPECKKEVVEFIKKEFLKHDVCFFAENNNQYFFIPQPVSKLYLCDLRSY